jgi:uncharacterized protein
LRTLAPRRAALLAIAALAALGAGAQVLVPAPSARVIDLTGTLSGGAVNRIEADLSALESSRESRIAVLIVPSTQAEDLEQYSARVRDAWRSAGTNVDDGALLLIAKDDRRVRIEPGRHLAPTFAAPVGSRIVEEWIVPHFELGDYDGGVEAGIDRMIAVVDGEKLPQPDRGWERHRRLPPAILAALLGAGLTLGLLILSHVSTRGWSSGGGPWRRGLGSSGAGGAVGVGDDGASGRW